MKKILLLILFFYGYIIHTMNTEQIKMLSSEDIYALCAAAITKHDIERLTTILNNAITLQSTDENENNVEDENSHPKKRKKNKKIIKLEKLPEPDHNSLLSSTHLERLLKRAKKHTEKRKKQLDDTTKQKINKLKNSGYIGVVFIAIGLTSLYTLFSPHCICSSKDKQSNNNITTTYKAIQALSILALISSGSYGIFHNLSHKTEKANYYKALAIERIIIEHLSQEKEFV